MYSRRWNIGINLSQTTIQLVAVRKHRKYWHLCECWQHNLPDNFASDTEIEQQSILLDILNQWRKKLPRNCHVSTSLPSLRTLKQQITLPEHLPLQQPELDWYLQARAEKYFPLNAEERIIDYRIINNQAYLNGARKTDILFWQDLFSKSGFTLKAIDVAPCALRYLARSAGLPDESWLVHYRQGEWLWVGPISQPTSYNQIQENAITSLSQLIPLLTEQLNQPIYYISDHHEPDAEHSWNLLQAFHSHTIKIPHQLGDFVIAAGLALRGKDNEYVSS
ncbi:type IV pilus biogenesis protein PilM [Providencia sneebia]|uniref:Pilus assembly protein HofM n=1 Tax=Providencia sneebia DSM 19967 TaxID=1141660 RepID=K8WJQ1_9GAMM|nr:pilus assembly protein PilM [Providencia sneebia]EKT60828.1 hypothetical protein OO7_01986 [Providencia sneebia DSM 19967]